MPIGEINPSDVHRTRGYHHTSARSAPASFTYALDARTAPPSNSASFTYALEHWYYAFKHGGLDALRPRPRVDRLT
jgi:hypothetical protein